MTLDSYNVARTVVKSDTVDIPALPGGAICQAIYVGGAGDVTLLGLDGLSTLFTAVPVGTIIPFLAKRIMSTGTAGGPFLCLYRV